MKLKHYIYSFIASVALLFAACSPDEYNLGAKDLTIDDLVEGLAYTITHDVNNPNIVYLESKVGSKYTALWEHPQGRSQEQKVTLKMPFAGTYKVTFGVMTAGGYVYGEPATFTIDQFYAGFVEDELWTLLSGGVGESKTWIHDNGKYGLASGEMDYADPSTTVEYNNFSPNWSPGKGHTGDDNIWQSTMTFSLAGGAQVEVHNVSANGNVDESGMFMLNTDAKTLTFTNANIMHTQGWNNKTTNWSKGLKILTLTKNQLQVAVLRELVSGESEWWMIWNYVSKEYADNYVPEDMPDPVPDIDGDANNILTTSNTKTWVLSTNSPYDWSDLNGVLMNNFAAASDYLSSGWAAYDADMIAATKFVFTSTSVAGGKFTFSSYGNEDIEGEYVIDSNNDIDFKQSLNAVISETDFGWISTMSLSTTAENKLRIVKTKTDALGTTVTDMWFGLRSTEKAEYMVYHFVLGGGGAPQVDVAKELKKQLTNNSSQTYKIDLDYPFTWGYKVGGGSHSFLTGEVPDWTNWTGSATNISNCEKVRFTFNVNGTMSYIDNAGIETAGTYQIESADDTYGVNIIKFYGVDPNFEMTGVSGGWVWFNMNRNDSGVTGMPADTNFFELYEWEYNSSGSVSGFWFGKLKDITATGAIEERTIYHYIVE